MKRFALGRFIGFFVALIGTGALFSISDAKPAASTPRTRTASFQFCFEVSHGRCFNTAPDGSLRQVGGHSESTNKVRPESLKKFELEIATFMKATAAAAPRKLRKCQQTLAYRSFDPQTTQMKIEAIRCIEFLKKSDTTTLSKLVAKLSLATKPSRK